MQIYIDLDYTLLDTGRLSKEIDKNGGKSDYRPFLYPDALEFLSYAARHGTLVLFSEGDVDFQKEKVKKIGLDKIFGQNIRIYPSYKKIFDLPNLATNKDIILIDDKPEIIDNAISLEIKTIRVRRGIHKDAMTTNSPSREVKDLKEIISKDLLGGL